MIRVCACESHPIVIEGLRRTLEDAEGLEFAGSVSELGAVLEFASERLPKVCLIDKAFGTKAVFQVISLRPEGALPGSGSCLVDCRDFRSRVFPQTNLKVHSPAVEAVLWCRDFRSRVFPGTAGRRSQGILMKNMPLSTILDCIDTVAKGNIWIENSVSNQFVGFINRRSTPRLTPREEEILSLVMRGMKNRQIAEELSITTGTVKVHLMHVFEKTGVKDRFELAMYGRKLRSASGEPEDDGVSLAKALFAP